MVLTRKITAGITAFSLLCTGIIMTSCSGEVSGTTVSEYRKKI